MGFRQIITDIFAENKKKNGLTSLNPLNKIIVKWIVLFTLLKMNATKIFMLTNCLHRLRKNFLKLMTFQH